MDTYKAFDENNGAHNRLEACGDDVNQLEKDIFGLRNQLRSSMERDRGRTSRGTLDLEAHLRVLQGRAMDLETQRSDILQHINQLRGKKSYSLRIVFKFGMGYVLFYEVKLEENFKTFILFFCGNLHIESCISAKI